MFTSSPYAFMYKNSSSKITKTEQFCSFGPGLPISASALDGQPNGPCLWTPCLPAPRVSVTPSLVAPNQEERALGPLWDEEVGEFPAAP